MDSVKYIISLLLLWGAILIGAESQNGVSKNYLTTRNGDLYDAQGNKVRLTGVNWFGFETAMMAPHGLWARDCKSMLMQIKSLGFNSVRFPWSNGMLREGKSIKIDSYGTDPYTGVSPMNGIEKNFTTPIQLLEQIIAYCQELNLKVILDSHARKADNYMGETIWYDESCSEQQWIDDWIYLVSRFKDYDCFVACDLDNEPHGKLAGATSATWGNSNPATDWNKAAERCGNAILSVNPNMLIMVEGVEAYQNTSYWWGGNLQGAKDFPVVLTKPSQLVYSPHEYGPTVFNQLWFSDPTFPSNLPPLWDNYFGYLYNSKISHLYVGEFGIKELGGKDEIWIKKWLEYMGANYSWAFWCWNPNSGDTGGILDDQWKSVVQWKVDLVAPYLAKEIPNGLVPTAEELGQMSNSSLFTIISSSNNNHDYSFKIQFSMITHGSVTVVDMMGNELYFEEFKEANELVFLNNLTKGVYIVTIQTNGQAISKKIMIN